MLSDKDIIKAKKARKQTLNKFRYFGRKGYLGEEITQLLGFSDCHIIQFILDTDEELLSAWRMGRAEKKAQAIRS